MAKSYLPDECYDDPTPRTPEEIEKSYGKEWLDKEAAWIEQAAKEDGRPLTKKPGRSQPIEEADTEDKFLPKRR